VYKTCKGIFVSIFPPCPPLSRKVNKNRSSSSTLATKQQQRTRRYSQLNPTQPTTCGTLNDSTRLDFPMVSDPYKALNLPHSATAEQIKSAYRSLARKYHPDRARNPDLAAKDFSEVTAGYAILNDPKRKAEYDHVYKYGGYDADPPPQTTQRPTRTRSQQQPHTSPSNSPRRRKGRSSSSTGIGYACHDPLLTYLLSQGRIKSTRTVAGIQIPSRPGSFTFAFSSGQSFTRDAMGRRTNTTQTTHFSDGQKHTRTEKTVVHTDGMKEVVVVDQQGNGDRTRRYFVEQSSSSSSLPRNNNKPLPTPKDGSWYLNAWRDVTDKLTMCYSPCAVEQ
jgi:curved DNA-binding protein CbpA